METQPELPPLPSRWIRRSVSVLIVAHLMAILGSVLIAESGPWPVGDMSDTATPPHFAQLLMYGTDFRPDPTLTAKFSVPQYLRAVKMTHNYHFLSNRPEDFGTRVEARLRDENGEVIATVQIPDPKADAIVQHRQKLLVEGLAQDIPVEPLPGEQVPAPNQDVRMVKIWETGEGNTGTIVEVAEHLIPRNRPVYGPSDWSQIVARSMARHLCDEHNANSVELIRITKPTIPPDVLFLDAPPRAGTFDESVFSFGVLNGRAKNS